MTVAPRVALDQPLTRGGSIRPARSLLSPRVLAAFPSCRCDTCERARMVAAVADGPVADTAETVAPQAVVSGADANRDDVDAMPHG